MTKKMKAKRKGSESAAILALVEPCGETCGVHKGVLCPECGEYAALHRPAEETGEKGEEDTELPVR